MRNSCSRRVEQLLKSRERKGAVPVCIIKRGQSLGRGGMELVTGSVEQAKGGFPQGGKKIRTIKVVR